MSAGDGEGRPANGGAGAAPPTTLTPKFDDIHPELAGQTIWVMWRWTWDADKEKWAKVPYTVEGRKASSTNARTWTTLANVRAAYEQSQQTELPFSGIGIVFPAGGRIVGHDIDHVIEPGGPIADEFAARAAAWPLAELSPSGTGFHCIGLGEMPGGKGRKVGPYELYDRGRYFTITGHLLHPHEPLRDVQATINATLAEMDRIQQQSKGTTRSAREQAGAGGSKNDADSDAGSSSAGSERRTELSEEDRALLARARKAKNAEKFGLLFDQGNSDVAGYKSQSEADAGLCRILAYWLARLRAVAKAEDIDRLFRASALMDTKWDETHGAQTYGEMTIAFVLNGMAAATTSSLPIVWTDDRQLHEIAEDAWQVVELNNTPEPFLFLHGTLVADIERDKQDGVPFIHHFGRTLMKGTIDRMALWRSHDAFGNAVPARPPNDVVDDMLALPAESLPELLGIVGAPVLSRDGHIDTTPGYQAANRLWYQPPRHRIPDLPLQPSSSDLVRAKELLFTEWLGDFPFVDEASRLHAVAVALTPIVRNALVPNLSPLFLYDATAVGTGKGLCANTASLITWGRVIPARAFNRDTEAMRKLITSILKEGPMFGLWDNLSDRIDSSELALLLTTTTWADRQLGKSLDLRLPNHTTWTATANTPSLSRDLVRRTVLIAMDAEMEHPSDRTDFRHPRLEQHVQQFRHRYLWALLVLVQHWVAQGMPQWKGVPMGSYESWCGALGGIFECAELGGFLSNINELRGRDSQRREWAEFVAMWYDRYQKYSVSARELVELAIEREASLKLLERLRLDRNGGPDMGTVVRMADELRRLTNRRFGPFKIVLVGKDGHTKSLRFRLDDSTRAEAAKAAAADEADWDWGGGRGPENER